MATTTKTTDHLLTVLEDAEACACCGSQTVACVCGWTGCLADADAETRFHSDVAFDDDEEA